MPKYEVELQYSSTRYVNANSEEEALQKVYAEMSKEAKDVIADYLVDNSYAIEIEEDDITDFIEKA